MSFVTFWVFTVWVWSHFQFRLLSPFDFFNFKRQNELQKNPKYRRHWVFWQMQIVSPIPKRTEMDRHGHFRGLFFLLFFFLFFQYPNFFQTKPYQIGILSLQKTYFSMFLITCEFVNTHVFWWGQGWCKVLLSSA